MEQVTILQVALRFTENKDECVKKKSRTKRRKIKTKKG
jgi:hypothetical protein